MRLVTKTLPGERPRSAWTDLSAYGSSRNHTLPSLSPSYPYLFVAITNRRVYQRGSEQVGTYSSSVRRRPGHYLLILLLKPQQQPTYPGDRYQAASPSS